MIRNSNINDIENIMTLIHQAQAYFKDNHIDQWQDGYPDKLQIQEDIKRNNSYVLDDNKIIGTMYFAIENDENYASINGQWLTYNQPYAVIHRIVVDNNYKGHGLAGQLLSFAVEECLKQGINSIRIDTHQDNLSMQRFLTKNGFILCGDITLKSGDPRIAFEKILNK
ncbi:MAG: GNAT family N-acetyltransferase [Erysipelotrichaceae bacterium]|nr:GNAT family N-acetyltransferase [Erysipelotrichaceae bacterium]